MSRNRQIPRTIALMIGLAAGLTISWFGIIAIVTSSVRQAEAAASFNGSTPQGSAGVTVAGEFTHPQISVNGRLVFDQAGYHVGKPQVSPDGRFVAITVVPAGTETAQYARTLLFDLTTGAETAAVTGYMPRWVDNGQRLLLDRPDAQVAFELATKTTAVIAAKEPEVRAAAPIASGQPFTYPTTIRVAHHPANTCRDVPTWQIDEIPFEEYVARVLPAEVPVSWQPDALKAQAVAARTYAWYQILQGRETYDVTDWADSQMMCNKRYPSSDAAVAATAGQYLSAASDSNHRPLIAMYSAKNGHPTKTNPNVDFLVAVPDLFALGEIRLGHGYGLSQWGAQRRASAGHSYRQILGHYYTNVHLQNALTPTVAIAGLLGPTPGDYLSVGGVQWRNLGPPELLTATLVLSSDVGLTRTEWITYMQSITHTDVVTDSNGVTQTVTLTDTSVVTESQVVTGPLTLLGGAGVWQYPVNLPDGANVFANFWISGTLQESMTLQVDRTPPDPPSVTIPDKVEVHTATITLDSPENTQSGLSNGWVWEGEDLIHQTDTGAAIPDSQASNGVTWEALAGVHSPGAWYGPYATGMPADASYRAVFRMRAGVSPAQSSQDLLPGSPIARLDVTDKSGSLLLGLRDIWPSDFATSTNYVDIPVDFYLFDPPEGLEFRVRWHGTMDLALDSVRVWQLHDGGTPQTFDWALNSGKTPSVQFVAFDLAGNQSQPISKTVLVVDDVPPTIRSVSIPADWQTGRVVTVSATVRDLGSGLDVDSGRVTVDGITHTAIFTQPENPWAEQAMVAVLDNVADGRHAVSFYAADRAGYVQASQAYTLSVDASRPDVTATTSLSSTSGWFSTTVQVTLVATDSASGISGIAYILDGDPFMNYTQPFTLTDEGMHAIRFWTQDRAGNYSFSRWAYVGIDQTPPDVQLSLTPISKDMAVATWSGDDPLSGIERYEVEMSRGNGPWEPVPLQAGEKSNQAQLTFEGAERLDFRVRAVDLVSNWSQWFTATTTPMDNWLYLPLVVR